MTTPKITIYDALTGETITRDYNDSELAQLEADKIGAAQKAKADLDKAAARQAVLNKLGLTADEITALLG